MVKRKNEEDVQFVKLFGPLLDALPKLGGSVTPDEVTGSFTAEVRRRMNSITRSSANFWRGPLTERWIPLPRS